MMKSALLLVALAASSQALSCGDAGLAANVPCVTVDTAHYAGNNTCAAKPTGSCDVLSALKMTKDGAVPELNVVVTLDLAPPVLATFPGSRVRLLADTQGRMLTASGAGWLLDVVQDSTLSMSGFAFGGSAGQYQAYAVVAAGGTLEITDSTFDGINAYATGTGAMTSYATVSSGVIQNHGTLRLARVTMRACKGEADSYTAMFTNANAIFTGVLNTGRLELGEGVVFNGVTSVALASSGDHGTPIGGASASATGGAVSNTMGGVVVATQATMFVHNNASASASSPKGGVSAAAASFAVDNQNGTVVLAGASFTAQNVTLTNTSTTVCVGCRADAASRVIGTGHFATCAEAPAAYACQAHTTCVDGAFGYSCTCEAGYKVLNATACQAA